MVLNLKNATMVFTGMAMQIVTRIQVIGFAVKQSDGGLPLILSKRSRGKVGSKYRPKYA